MSCLRGTLGRKCHKACGLFSNVQKQQEKNIGKTNMAKINNDQIQLFCASGMFSVIKIRGGWAFAEFLCVFQVSDQVPSHFTDTQK